MKPIPKEDIQSLERDILFQVLDFFEQYHITYFTSGGTTLGAVRHEGFIPWDDDIDLYIPRADYNRMLQLDLFFLLFYNLDRLVLLMV